MRETFRRCALILSFPLLLVACGGGYGRPDSAGSQLAFGVDMAKRGLWSEALFRFHQAERLDPNNSRVYNNLAVAYEAIGEYQRALDYYQRALKMSPDSRDLRANYARFVEFYQGFKPDEQTAGPAADPTEGQPRPTAPPASAAPLREPPPAQPRSGPGNLPDPGAPQPPPVEPPTTVPPPPL